MSAKICSVNGCGKRVMGRGWCATHYQRWKFHGDPFYEPRTPNRLLQCSVPICAEPVHQRGFCRAHYMRWYRHGDPLEGNASPIFEGADGRKEYRKQHYEKNRTAYLERAKKQPVEQARSAKKAYKERNPAKVRAATLARKRDLAEATPNWLTADQYRQMNLYYTEAKRLSAETGVPHHVDHIVPLRGRIVCGLHVPWNLRVITARENMKRPRTYIEVSPAVP